MTKERVELYRNVSLPGQPIHVVMITFPVDYYVPDDNEVDWLVCRLLLNCSWGPLGMKVEYFHQWLQESMRE